MSPKVSRFCCAANVPPASEMREPDGYRDSSNRLSYGGLEAALHISVCGIDKFREGIGVNVTVGPELHMPHVPASAFQQAHRIRKLGTTKNPTLTCAVNALT